MAKALLNDSEQDLIKSAIQEAEKATSGEVKVHVEAHCKEDAMDRAAYVFEQLEMHRTAQRNGVLI